MMIIKKISLALVSSLDFILGNLIVTSMSPADCPVGICDVMCPNCTLIFCPRLSLFVKNYSEFEILPSL